LSFLDLAKVALELIDVLTVPVVQDSTVWEVFTLRLSGVYPVSLVTTDLGKYLAVSGLWVWASVAHL
jgi:hypothetical protein